jgi:hypothetical protein
MRFPQFLRVAVPSIASGLHVNWVPACARTTAASGFCSAIAVNVASFRDFCRLSRILGASSHVDGEAGGEWVKFNHTNSLQPLERIMKTPKNFEALFLVAAVTVTFATFAMAAEPARYAAAPAVATAVIQTAPMQVVVIKGHRLTAAEKAKSI